jgi:single-stranded DNA-binding protein
MAQPGHMGRTGQPCRAILKKGDEVSVEGKLTTRNYTDKDGNKRYITEIVVNEFLKLSSKTTA